LGVFLLPLLSCLVDFGEWLGIGVSENDSTDCLAFVFDFINGIEVDALACLLTVVPLLCFADSSLIEFSDFTTDLDATDGVDFFDLAFGDVSAFVCLFLTDFDITVLFVSVVAL